MGKSRLLDSLLLLEFRWLDSVGSRLQLLELQLLDSIIEGLCYRPAFGQNCRAPIVFNTQDGSLQGGTGT